MDWHDFTYPFPTLPRDVEHFISVSADFSFYDKPNRQITICLKGENRAELQRTAEGIVEKALKLLEPDEAA